VDQYQALRSLPRFTMSGLLALLECMEQPNRTEIAMYGMAATPAAAGFDEHAAMRLTVFARCPNEEIMYLVTDVITR